MDAVTFDGLFGWLHRPQTGKLRTIGFQASGFDTGVVLVSPLGRDARCAHAPMRLFADDLAAAGFPTLRYDHRGEGDSLGLTEPDADATAVWLCGVRAAVDELRALTGVRRVVLGGVRLGATFAQIAADCADGLILLAPVLTGRSWLQQMRFAAGGAGGGDAVDIGGLYLSPATASGLSQIDLNQEPPPRRAIFLAAQNRMVRTYGQSLSAAGGSPVVVEFTGFHPMFADAHSNEAPFEVFAAARAWLVDTFAEGAAARSLERAPKAAELRPPGALERAVVFGQSLQGVLCEPEPRQPRGPAVLFCNTGGDPRAGIGGFATTAARALAARGIASLRFDFQGLGDSPMSPPTERGHIYETPREGDLHAAVSRLTEEGYDQIALVGLCAGAYHALKYAPDDPRVAGVFAISPVKLVWRRDDSLVFGRRDDGPSTKIYMKALGEPETYLRLLKGRIDVAVVVRNLIKRLRDRLAGVADRMAGRSPLAALGRFSRRGGRVHLMMGTDDVSLDEVQTWFGQKARRLTRLPGMSVAVDPRLDHGLAFSMSRRLALDALLDWHGPSPKAPEV